MCTYIYKHNILLCVIMCLHVYTDDLLPNVHGKYKRNKYLKRTPTRLYLYRGLSKLSYENNIKIFTENAVNHECVIDHIFLLVLKLLIRIA